VSSHLSITVAPGIDITPDAGDPLVTRREEITREMLREGVRSLSQLERDALRLATRERLPVTEIAAQMNIEPEAAQSSLRTGLLNLRQSLINQLGES
jgi:DNA-directed RNA polymerase specialized sigma24 family protein